MSKLKEGENLDLEHWVRTWRQLCKQASENQNCESCKKRNGERAKEECEQAYQQIKEMIQKPEVTEEWKEEKAKEFLEMAYAITRTKPDIAEHRINLKFVKQSFIRSFVEEITKKEEEDG